MSDFVIKYWWLFIWITLALILTANWFMVEAGRSLYYDRWTRRAFSIIDLQFPSSARYYSYIMTSLIKENKKSPGKYTPLKALKRCLWWDFIFMFGIYPFIALVAIHLACRMDYKLFLVLAIAQCAAWLFDLLENGIIFYTMKHPKLFLVTKYHDNTIRDEEQKERTVYFFYKYVVLIKWIIALSGLIFSLLTVLYIYLYQGKYTNHSLANVLITLILFLLIYFTTNLFHTTREELDD